MDYKPINYTSREEAMAAFIKMKRRKQEWIEKTEQDFHQG